MTGHAHGPGLALGVLAAVLGAYAVAVVAQHRAGRRWSPHRSAAFVAGVGALAVAAVLPSVGVAGLRGHMVQHVLVGMLAPLGLVLGAPISLVLRTLSVRAARRVACALQSGPVRALTHVATAAVLNVGGMAVLYLTPLYAATMASPALHVLVHVHVVAAGCLFTWAVLAGPDPAPHPAPFSVRVGVLVVAAGAHAVLAKTMAVGGWPRGTPFGPDEIVAAAQVMYYGGDLAEVALAVALFGAWYRRRASAPAPSAPEREPLLWRQTRGKDGSSIA